MKAVVIRRIGDEGVLRYEEVPDPSIGPTEVLLRIRAASVNRGDLGRRRGGGAAPSDAPLIVGWDVAGEIAEVGSEVRNLRPGQRIVARLAAGGYAELAAVPASVVMPLPQEVSYEQAAALRWCI